MGCFCPAIPQDSSRDIIKTSRTSRRQRQILNDIPSSDALKDMLSAISLASHREDEITVDQKAGATSRFYRKTIYDFIVVRGLGKGTFGKVYLVKERDANEPVNDSQNIMVYQEQEQGIPFNNEDVPEIIRLGQSNQLRPTQKKVQKHLFTPQKTTQPKSKATLSTQPNSSRGPPNNSPFINSRLQSGNRYFALKVLRKSDICSEKQRKQTLSERWILESNDHPFIVKLHYAFQSRKKLYMVVDLMAGGQLFYLLRRYRRFPESIAKFYAAQILLALEYLHSKSIIYRDLKPQNILLDRSGHIKLTDFGLSKILYSLNQKTYSLCGTVEYMAPEIIIGGGYSQAADWFSYASLLYDMLTGKPPFFNTDRIQMMKDLASKEVPIPDDLSPEAKDLLRHLFKIDPEERLGFKKGAGQIKAHKFFAGTDFGALYRRDIEAPISFDTPGGENQIINNGGFQNWSSCNLKVVSSPSAKRNIKSPMQHFEGFTFEYASPLEQNNV